MALVGTVDRLKIVHVVNLEMVWAARYDPSPAGAGVPKLTLVSVGGAEQVFDGDTARAIFNEIKFNDI